MMMIAPKARGILRKTSGDTRQCTLVTLVTGERLLVNRLIYLNQQELIYDVSKLCFWLCFSIPTAHKITQGYLDYAR